MVKRPLLIACIGYLIGIIYGLYLIEISIPIFFLSILLIIILKKRLSKNIKRYIKIILPKKAITILAIFLIIGTFHINALNKKYNKIYEIKEKVNIIGIIEEIEPKEYTNKYILKIESINNKKQINTKLILTTKLNLEYGDCIKIKAQYFTPDDSRNYKGFSYRNYLKQKSIYGTIEPIGNIEIVERGKINFISKLANSVKSIIINKSNNNLSENASSVFLGILLGEKSQISDEISTYFKLGNMSHILAVSGAHVGYIILMVNILLGKTQKKFYSVCTIIILVFFMVITNFMPSVVRACTMSIIAIFAKLVYRKSDIYNNLAISAFLILLSNPYTILNIGFQLTYLGTLGIVLLSKRMSTCLYNKIFHKENKESKLTLKNRVKTKVKKYITNTILISISVQILIAPIIIFNFNTLSYNFLISGILATPIFACIMLVGIISLIAFPLEKICFLIVEILINCLIFISKILSSIPFSKIIIPTPHIVWVIFYYLAFAIILISKSKISYRIIKSKEKIIKVLKKVLIPILIVCIIAQFFILVKDRNLKIFFIDVGQGDASLIITPKNKVILIDGGGSSDKSYDVGENILIPYLLDRGIKSIDYIIISHFDNDHVGGILTVMKELKVKNIIIGKQFCGTENLKEFLEIVNSKKINLIIAQATNRINVETNLYFDIIWPNSKYEITQNSINNNALVCKLYYKNFTMLFTGDIEEEAEKVLVSKYSDTNILKSVVLKVPHHGSKSSSTENFIKLVNPKIALIGVGKNNKYGHPNNSVLETLMHFRS